MKGEERVRVGMLVPQYGASAAEAIDGARAAEAAGLDVFVAGQLVPISGSKDKSALEPLTLMGAIATATSRARLGFMVLAAPYLPPYYYAKALLTLNELAGGRLEVGLGAGWREEEFAALSMELGAFSDRLASVEATLDALAEQGGADATALPVWIAGSGPKVLRLAARRAQWTNFARGISIEDFSEKGRQVREVAAEQGNAEPPRLSLTATFLSADEAELEGLLHARARKNGLEADEYAEQLRAANVFLGSPEELAAQMRPFVEEGCRAFVLWPLDGDYDAAARQLGEASRLLEER